LREPVLVDRIGDRGYDPLVAPRPGEIWKRPDGRLIVVADVTGSAISGTSSPLELGVQGPLGPGMGAVDYRGHVEDFEAFELVGPHWTATFTAAVAGPHPTQDQVLAIVQISARSSAGRSDPQAGPRSRRTLITR
jgi:hypothetical protein